MIIGRTKTGSNQSTSSLYPNLAMAYVLGIRVRYRLYSVLKSPFLDRPGWGKMRSRSFGSFVWNKNTLAQEERMPEGNSFTV